MVHDKKHLEPERKILDLLWDTTTKALVTFFLIT
jgi:hypothetical protein